MTTPQERDETLADQRTTQEAAPDPADVAQLQERDAQIADLQQQIAALHAQLAASDQRVRYVEQEYRKLQQANGTAANGLLAANHPLA